MIRVAVAGTCGLAQYIADFIATTTSHQFVILSRHVSASAPIDIGKAYVIQANPALSSRGWQVLQVDYSNHTDLRYKLAGIDTVISTIGGAAQLALIDAAAGAHVRRFVPSEFEGSPTARPQQDVFDNGRRQAVMRLVQHDPSGLKFTVFTCGIFYERFAPGGMRSLQIGLRSAIGDEGQYLMDFRHLTAQYPYYNSAGQPVYVCMTSARDVARLLVAALSLTSWPREFRLRGERMTVANIVAIGEQIRGQHFQTSSFSVESLQDELTVARAVKDVSREMRAHHLLATANGRYDFSSPNLNERINIRPERFREWLVRVWSHAI